MAIKGKWKFQNRESKYILKKMSEAVLPKSIIYRPKTPFIAPIRSWLSCELVEMVNDILSEKELKKTGYFSPCFVQNLIQRDRNGMEDNALKIYQLLTLQLWFQEIYHYRP